jgi:glycosyltransferase involved in cell wall biosynthesis
MSNKSLVSAVIPTYNRPQLVQRAVRSALAQDYAELEVIVVVDGPDIETEKVLEDILDTRLRVIVLPRPVGAAEARNLGVAAARGDWIAFLDDDDEWLPEKTKLQMKVAQNSKYLYPIVSSQLIAQTSRYELVWPRTLPFQPLSEYLLSRKSWSYGEGLLSTITLLFPKELYYQVPFQAGLPRHQDLDWVLRATEHAGAGLEFVPKPLAVWHMAEQRKSISVTADWKTSFQWLESVRGKITRRAYAGFVATQLASLAARQGAWRDLPFLVKKLITYGAPTARDIVIFLGMWIVPRRVRRLVRQEGV